MIQQEQLSELEKLKVQCVDEYSALLEEKYEIGCRSLEASIKIGRALITIDSIYINNKINPAFDVGNLFLESEGNQVINPRLRMLYKKIAKISDIEDFIWLGLKTVRVILSSVEDIENKKIKTILLDMGIEISQHDLHNSLKVRKMVSYYQTFIKIKYLKGDVKFNKMVACIEKGYDFDNELLLDEIKTSKEVNKKLEYMLSSYTYNPPVKSKGTKRTKAQELESNTVLFLHSLEDALDDNEGPIHLDIYQNHMIRDLLSKFTINNYLAYRKQNEEIAKDDDCIAISKAMDDEIGLEDN